MDSNGHIRDTNGLKPNERRAAMEDFVLDKSIFSNIFDKDIKRVYIYKKAERLAKAIHLIGPAFVASPALRDRLDLVAVGLVDAAIEPPMTARTKLSRELLALSSVLGIARTSGLLSAMNAELIAREAQSLLQEVASYEEPRLFLDAAPTLAELSRDLTSERHTTRSHPQAPQTSRISPIQRSAAVPEMSQKTPSREASPKGQSIGQLSDKKSDRQEAILSVLKSKGPTYIKDISTVIRDVSEKTIQRELQDLVEKGIIERSGERRWTTYVLAS
jgi:hypothetical protein